MRLRISIIIVPLLCLAVSVHAQMPQEEQPSSMPEQWQLTLDVIKSKAQTLMTENNGLEGEYQQLMRQVQRLEQSIKDQQYKNEQMELFLKERHGRTDQQFRIEDLKQGLKIKKQQLRVVEDQLRNMERKQSDLEHMIKLLNETVSDAERNQQKAAIQIVPVQHVEQQPQVDDQLIQLRKQLEDENKQEVLLGNELAALKTGGKISNVNVVDIVAQNKDLESQLDQLRLQKLQHEQKVLNIPVVHVQDNGEKYEALKKRKDQLEADIRSYETRLDKLRESSLMAMSWSFKKKKLVHEMVQTDAHNNQMREKIKELREDIGLLRDQVAKLERRIDFVQGK